MNRAISYRPGRQRGAVLIVALVLLLVLTVLGTAGLQDTTMEERMAGNFRDISVAQEAAEAALREGEAFIPEEIARVFPTGVPSDKKVMQSQLGGTPDDASDTDGTYSVVAESKDPYNVAVYTLTVSVDVGGDITAQGPLFFVEVLPGVDLPESEIQIGRPEALPPQTSFYRVTAKGFGISPNSEVILQSTFWNGL